MVRCREIRIATPNLRSHKARRDRQAWVDGHGSNVEKPGHPGSLRSALTISSMTTASPTGSRSTLEPPDAVVACFEAETVDDDAGLAHIAG
jgi:hypothetical protein